MQKNTEPNCPNCGANSYSWGAVRSKYGLRYIDENAGFWGKTAFGGTPMKVRKCDACGNLQFFNREEK